MTEQRGKLDECCIWIKIPAAAGGGVFFTSLIKGRLETSPDVVPVTWRGSPAAAREIRHDLRVILGGKHFPSMAADGRPAWARNHIARGSDFCAVYAGELVVGDRVLVTEYDEEHAVDLTRTGMFEGFLDARQDEFMVLLDGFEEATKLPIQDGLYVVLR